MSLQKLSNCDPNELGMWTKDSDGFGCLTCDMWTKFKRNHEITKTKHMDFSKL